VTHYIKKDLNKIISRFLIRYFGGQKAMGCIFKLMRGKKKPADQESCIAKVQKKERHSQVNKS